VRAIVTSEPELVTREIAWDEGCGGDSSEPISYVSLASFHALSEHDRMGEIARVLLAAGAPVEGAAGCEETPIVTAASYDRADVAAVLAEAGADLYGRGHAAPGVTALAHAVYFGNPAVADVLVRAGARPRTLAEAAGAGDLSGWPLEDRSAEELAWALRGAALVRAPRRDRPASGRRRRHSRRDRRRTGAAVGRARRKASRPAPSCRTRSRSRAARREYDATPLGWCRHRNEELFAPSPGHDAVVAYLEPFQADADRS